MKVKLPRLVIAAPQSGSGKSIIASGLMALLSRSMSVQGFKVGPDYIDPGYHTRATGRVSRNLDAWMVSEEQVKRTFSRASEDADLAIIEGVMGLYDGYDARSEAGSTAQIAKLLGAPVILVIDVSKMARSAGAIALGFRDFDPNLNLAGVICNKVASQKHAKWVNEAVGSTGIPVLGCIPRQKDLAIPERHLGLHMAEERLAQVDELLGNCSRLLEENLDIRRLKDLAQTAPVLEIEASVNRSVKGDVVRIGVARDEAFCFYYEDNLDELRNAGAEIVYFSPLRDKALPQDLAGIYLGGGYPELYAVRLAENHLMKESIKEAAEKNMPVYAECGGLMFLSHSVYDLDGNNFEMLGLIPGYTRMVKKLSMGYREVSVLRENCLLPPGQTARGHEFHYSEWVRSEVDFQPAYQVKRRFADEAQQAGYSSGNLLASYIHIHFGSNPLLAGHFVDSCRTWQAAEKKT